MDIYERDYIKVQDTFAMMGGFINFSFIILKLLVKYVTKPRIIKTFNENYCYSNIKENQIPNVIPIQNSVIQVLI